MSANGVAVLIPAYRPGSTLIDLARQLLAAGLGVVVVDDGSGPDFAPTFAAIEQLPGVSLLRHVTNLGKGAALKTGLNHVACTSTDAPGVVTADADGQHTATDILAVAECLARDPQELVLGARKFDGAVPFRNRLGNSATRALVRLLTGQRVADAQSGLRGIPMWFIPRLLRIPYQAYEFELEMLLICKYEGIRIQQVAIATIYLDQNRSSHFNPLLDSFRIYCVLFRFALVSIVSAVLDNLVFAAVYLFRNNIIEAQICGRVLATLFNYLGNKTTVFRSTERATRTLPRYLLLVLVSGMISYGLIDLLTESGMLDVYVAKIVAETLLFVFNFAVQRDFIFPRAEPTGGAVSGLGNSRRGSL